MAATQNINAEKIQGNLSILGITGTSISATTISGGTFYGNGSNLMGIPQQASTVTGATYSNNNFTFTNNTGGTFSVLFNTVTGLTTNGNLTVTGTTSSGVISLTPSGLITVRQPLFFTGGDGGGANGAATGGNGGFGGYGSGDGGGGAGTTAGSGGVGGDDGLVIISCI